MDGPGREVVSRPGDSRSSLASRSRPRAVTVTVTTGPSLGGASWRSTRANAPTATASVSGHWPLPPPEAKVVGSNPAWRIELRGRSADCHNGCHSVGLFWGGTVSRQQSEESPLRPCGCRPRSGRGLASPRVVASEDQAAVGRHVVRDGARRLSAGRTRGRCAVTAARSPRAVVGRNASTGRTTPQGTTATSISRKSAWPWSSTARTTNEPGASALQPRLAPGAALPTKLLSTNQ